MFMFILDKNKLFYSKLIRSFCTNKSVSLILENLSSTRSLVRVSGAEVEPFLQGLITNDIKHVSKPNKSAAMYTMFLNKPGRVLYDALIYKLPDENDTFYIECDRQTESELRKHLLTFRVRKKIDIDNVRDQLNVWSAFSRDVNEELKKINLSEQSNSSQKDKLIRFHDPRCAALGTRIIASSNLSSEVLKSDWLNQHFINNSDYDYTQHRYKLGIGEGLFEVPIGKIFPFEANCDFLHGISFHKGCYLGQEFTARTYHTGVIRKRIMPIELTTKSDQTNELTIDAPITEKNGQSVGKLRGIKNNYAIGLLRVEQVLKAKVLKIGNIEASTGRPFWWPVITSEK